MALNQETVIEVAKEMMRQEGCRRITMDDISQKLRISKRTLYENFANKEVLVEAVLENVKAELDGRKQQYKERLRKTGDDPLLVMLFAIKHFENYNYEYSKLMEEANVMYPDIMDRLFMPGGDECESDIVAELTKMEESGSLRKGVDKEILARSVIWYVTAILRDKKIGYETSVKMIREVVFSTIRGILSLEKVVEYEQKEKAMRDELSMGN